MTHSVLLALIGGRSQTTMYPSIANKNVNDWSCQAEPKFGEIVILLQGFFLSKLGEVLNFCL